VELGVGMSFYIKKTIIFTKVMAKAEEGLTPNARQPHMQK
jgi:hypothetical protein